MWKTTSLWSEIRSGFKEPGGTPPPWIPRSTSPGGSIALTPPCEQWFLSGLFEGKGEYQALSEWRQTFEVGAAHTSGLGSLLFSRKTIFFFRVRALDCEQSLRMVKRARKSSESKKQEAMGKLSLSAISLSPVLPSLERDCLQSMRACVCRAFSLTCPASMLQKKAFTYKKWVQLP